MGNKKENIILVGGGGHCKACIEVIEATDDYNIIGILDLASEFGKNVLGYPVIGDDEDYLKYKNKKCSFLVTAGQIKFSQLRKRIFGKLKKIDAKLATVIAPTARVSKHAKIGEGSIIMHHAIINAGVEILQNCIVNTASILEHDVQIGSHVHVSTNAVINGDSKIGEESFIGSKVCLINGITVGNKIIIGAGSTVTKDCLNNGTYVGSPAKKIK